MKFLVSVLVIWAIAVVMVVWKSESAHAENTGSYSGLDTYPTVHDAWQPAADGVVHVDVYGSVHFRFAKKAINKIVAPLGISTVFHNGGTCADDATENYCVTISVVDIAESDVWGDAVRYSNRCDIAVDPVSTNYDYVPTHEFMHCLGMAHHTYGNGILRTPQNRGYPKISKKEWAALYLAY